MIRYIATRMQKTDGKQHGHCNGSWHYGAVHREKGFQKLEPSFEGPYSSMDHSFCQGPLILGLAELLSHLTLPQTNMEKEKGPS